MAFFKERIRSFGYAFAGIFHAFRTQPNARIHLVVAVVAIACGLLLKISLSEWCFVTVAIAVVFAAELFNTAMERMVDMMSPERREAAGRIKDLSAGAVLIVSIMAVILGCMIFLPNILHWVSTGSVAP
jgi:diacylglycerol kinase (ATP)